MQHYGLAILIASAAAAGAEQQSQTGVAGAVRQEASPEPRGAAPGKPKAAAPQPEEASGSAPRRQTEVSIRRDAFLINGQPTYQGRTWQGHKIEGLLLNSRMVQGIFHDLNPETAGRWAYPDTGAWDPERNTREFLAAMPSWRAHGLLAFTINLQGGSPEGYTTHRSNCLYIKLVPSSHERSEPWQDEASGRCSPRGWFGVRSAWWILSRTRVWFCRPCRCS